MKNVIQTTIGAKSGVPTFSESSVDIRRSSLRKIDSRNIVVSSYPTQSAKFTDIHSSLVGKIKANEKSSEENLKNQQRSISTRIVEVVGDKGKIEKESKVLSEALVKSRQDILDYRQSIENADSKITTIETNATDQIGEYEKTLEKLKKEQVEAPQNVAILQATKDDIDKKTQELPKHLLTELERLEAELQDLQKTQAKRAHFKELVDPDVAREGFVNDESLKTNISKKINEIAEFKSTNTEVLSHSATLKDSLDKVNGELESIAKRLDSIPRLIQKTTELLANTSKIRDDEIYEQIEIIAGYQGKLNETDKLVREGGDILSGYEEKTSRLSQEQTRLGGELLASSLAIDKFNENGGLPEKKLQIETILTRQSEMVNRLTADLVNQFGNIAEFSTLDDSRLDGARDKFEESIKHVQALIEEIDKHADSYLVVKASRGHMDASVSNIMSLLDHGAADPRFEKSLIQALKLNDEYAMLRPKLRSATDETKSIFGKGASLVNRNRTEDRLHNLHANALKPALQLARQGFEPIRRLIPETFNAINTVGDKVQRLLVSETLAKPMPPSASSKEALVAKAHQISSILLHYEVTQEGLKHSPRMLMSPVEFLKQLEEGRIDTDDTDSQKTLIDGIRDDVNAAISKQPGFGDYKSVIDSASKKMYSLSKDKLISEFSSALGALGVDIKQDFFDLEGVPRNTERAVHLMQTLTDVRHDVLSAKLPTKALRDFVSSASSSVSDRTQKIRTFPKAHAILDVLGRHANLSSRISIEATVTGKLAPALMKAGLEKAMSYSLYPEDGKILDVGSLNEAETKAHWSKLIGTVVSKVEDESILDISLAASDKRVPTSVLKPKSMLDQGIMFSGRPVDNTYPDTDDGKAEQKTRMAIRTLEKLDVSYKNETIVQRTQVNTLHTLQKTVLADAFKKLEILSDPLMMLPEAKKSMDTAKGVLDETLSAQGGSWSSATSRADDGGLLLAKHKFDKAESYLNSMINHPVVAILREHSESHSDLVSLSSEDLHLKAESILKDIKTDLASASAPTVLSRAEPKAEGRYDYDVKPDEPDGESSLEEKTKEDLKPSADGDDSIESRYEAAATKYIKDLAAITSSPQYKDLESARQDLLSERLSDVPDQVKLETLLNAVSDKRSAVQREVKNNPALQSYLDFVDTKAKRDEFIDTIAPEKKPFSISPDKLSLKAEESGSKIEVLQAKIATLENYLSSPNTVSVISSKLDKAKDALSAALLYSDDPNNDELKQALLTHGVNDQEIGDVVALTKTLKARLQSLSKTYITEIGNLWTSPVGAQIADKVADQLRENNYDLTNQTDAKYVNNMAKWTKDTISFFINDIASGKAADIALTSFAVSSIASAAQQVSGEQFFSDDTQFEFNAVNWVSFLVGLSSAYRGAYLLAERALGTPASVMEKADKAAEATATLEAKRDDGVFSKALGQLEIELARVNLKEATEVESGWKTIAGVLKGLVNAYPAGFLTAAFVTTSDSLRIQASDPDGVTNLPAVDIGTAGYVGFGVLGPANRLIQNSNEVSRVKKDDAKLAKAVDEIKLMTDGGLKSNHPAELMQRFTNSAKTTPFSIVEALVDMSLYGPTLGVRLASQLGQVSSDVSNLAVNTSFGVGGSIGSTNRITRMYKNLQFDRTSDDMAAYLTNSLPQSRHERLMKKLGVDEARDLTGKIVEEVMVRQPALIRDEFIESLRSEKPAMEPRDLEDYVIRVNMFDKKEAEVKEALIEQQRLQNDLKQELPNINRQLKQLQVEVKLAKAALSSASVPSIPVAARTSADIGVASEPSRQQILRTEISDKEAQIDRLQSQISAPERMKKDIERFTAQSKLLYDRIDSQQVRDSSTAKFLLNVGMKPAQILAIWHSAQTVDNDALASDLLDTQLSDFFQDKKYQNKPHFAVGFPGFSGGQFAGGDQEVGADGGAG